MPILISFAFAASVAFAPPLRFQDSGQMACVVYDKTRDKVLLTRPFATSGASQDSKYDAFIGSLRAQGYLPATSEIEGACSTPSSAERATATVTAFRNRYATANQLTVPFE